MEFLADGRAAGGLLQAFAGQTADDSVAGAAALLDHAEHPMLGASCVSAPTWKDDWSTVFAEPG